MVKKILTSDILVTDIIVNLKDAPDLQGLIDKYNLKSGGKITINKGQFEAFKAAVKDRPYYVAPGGSSANVLTTIKKCLGDRVEADFIGIVGDGMHRQEILDSLNKTGIRLHPPEEKLSRDIPHEGATSFVIMFPDGERTIATYPGNAKDLLKPEHIDEGMIGRNNVLFVQGSLWNRMDRDFANKLTDLRWQRDAELWLALPTTAFGGGDPEVLKFLMASANIIVANDEELAANVYHTTPDKALEELQKTLKNHTIGRQNGEQHKHLPEHQVAFITRGAKGAALITDKEIKNYPPMHSNLPIKNTLGAGDAAFGGFYTGHLLNMSQEDCVRMGMTFAAAKLREDGPRLSDPLRALRKDFPHIAKGIESMPHRGDYIPDLHR